METMEGAAAAQIAMYYGIPFLEIRSACNIVGNRNRQNWNLEDSFINACESVIIFLNYYLG